MARFLSAYGGSKRAQKVLRKLRFLTPDPRFSAARETAVAARQYYPQKKSRAAASIILEKSSSEFVKGLPETARRKFADFFVQNCGLAAGFFARQAEVRILRHKIDYENVRNSHICFARRKPFVI